MRKYINLYLDESGNDNFEFFSIGGFYLIDDNYSNIEIVEKEIELNILKIEKK